MAQTHTWRARRIHFMHRVHARSVSRAKPATAFVSSPEPRTIGRFTRGRQLVAGNFLFSGSLTEAPDMSIWDIAGDNQIIINEIQGCAWLDDLAAVGNDKARNKAQTWVFDWIARYGDGKGPGWSPDVVGRRLIRWINHGYFLLHRQEKPASDQFFKSLAQQTIYLSRRWKVTTPGLPRFEALAGMIYAALSLEGLEEHVDLAVQALAHDCTNQIDVHGGLATRNPEEVLEVFSLLTWTLQALTETGRRPPPQIMSAIGRIAPTLRALRHSDGGLARFHGGGRGIEGRLDQALASSGVKTLADNDLHMGFARLTAGRTSLIVDAAPPPTGSVSTNAHASTLAFELTSARRPLIVNCGSGSCFGDDWRRAGRATPSHTTLGIDGYSSSRVSARVRMNNASEPLVEVPQLVLCESSLMGDGRRLELSHDGYRTTHGLTHARTLDLSMDGRGLVGEDLLATLDDPDKARFDSAREATEMQGIPFSIRFHLHPDVTPGIDRDSAAVSMVLKSGEVWIFRHDASAQMSLISSVYLENGRLKPRPTHQVVLSGRAMAYATRVRWSLAKAQDTPDVVRDFVQSDPMDSVDD